MIGIMVIEIGLLEGVIVYVELICIRNGIKFIDNWCKIFEVVYVVGWFIGVYDIIDVLLDSIFGVKLLIVYWVLEFLFGIGLVYKIEFLNVFMSCVYFGYMYVV